MPAKDYEADIARRDENITLGEDGKPEFRMRLGKREYTERKDAGAVLVKVLESNQYANKIIGSYRGFEIIPKERNLGYENPAIILKGARVYTISVSDSDVGIIARIDNALERLETYRDDDRRDIGDYERRLEASKLQLTRPFEQEQELADTLAELTRINLELDIDRGADDGALLDDDSQNEAENKDSLDMDDEDEDEPEM